MLLARVQPPRAHRQIAVGRPTSATATSMSPRRRKGSAEGSARVADLIGWFRGDVLEQTRMDTRTQPPGPRLVQLGDIEGGHVVDQHAEGME